MKEKIEETHFCKQVGNEMEIMRLATEKARKELSEYHTYQDGYVDRPLLNCDTVQED